MRRLFLFLLLLSFSNMFAQVNIERVLIETGTATWNNGCSNEVDIIDELKNQGLDISFINYHLNDPFGNPDANIRATYYNIQSVPKPIVNGEHILAGDIQNYIDAYEEAINQTSSFVMSADGSFLGDTLFLELTIEKVYDYESDEIKLHTALTESNIAYEWLSQDELHEVERTMAPDANGVELDFSESETLIFNFKILLEENWNPGEMELTTFVQNDTSKQVLQCHSVALTAFAPLPVHAFFQVEDTLICRKDRINFQNFSTGDVETYQWYFEGGTPETSNEEFPSVNYETAGDFDVRLIVQNSISLDTTIKYDYIQVQELPTMGFAPLPEFCHDDPPYQLTEAWPEEGNYFGLFVDTGYFHPENAGQGQYTVYFAYQNEETLCSDTLSQQAIVQLCNAINETEEAKEIVWFWKENQLQLELQENLLNSNTKILLYTLSGQLFDKTEPIQSNSVLLDIPPQIKSFVLVVQKDNLSSSIKIIR